MSVKEFIQQNMVYLDGGTGTLLQAAGLPLGELPERWNISHAEVLQDIHRAYFDAGSNIVATNTFGANALKFTETELETLVQAAIDNVRKGAERSVGKQEKFVALDIGPSGKLLQPYGDFAFEDAVELFAKTVRLGEKYGADCVLLETFGDAYEVKAALLAVKENCDLPVFVSCAYGSDGKLMTGATPSAMVALCEGMGADAVGVNCSVGPMQMTSVVEELLEKASVPVLVKPNAGLPIAENGATRYDITEEEFAAQMRVFAEKGARMLGGCCGTTPEYIAALVARMTGFEPVTLVPKMHTCISSYTHAVEFDKPILIGERINPTGKKRFKQALLEKDTAYILNEGLTQQEKGAQVLDVNVGLPDIDECAELPRYVQELQAVVDLPLQIDTSNAVAMERAMRLYNGKPLVNSVNGKAESMSAVFPLVKKYGGVVIALTLDERGIPETAEGRVEIAERILAEGAKYGILKKDIVVDPLAMTVSADPKAANTTLRAIELLTAKGIKTSLGVSNVSFGLPSRETVNATFFALALQKGLSAAILNPNSVEMLKTYYAYLALTAKDESCREYIRFATEEMPKYAPVSAQIQTCLTETKTGEISPLKGAIVKGLKEEASRACENLLSSLAPLEIVHQEIVPALDEVGKGYEEKRVFLPQLLMSAEAAKAAFEKIKLRISQTGEAQAKKCKIVLATVKGDIHDIGKNIVATLLDNYGFEVIDLGRDVSPERVLETALHTGAPIVGLSALMTTTVPSMAETIALLRENAPEVKIMIGGAVLTEEYARKLGADGYGKDGMAAVRFAESVYTNICKK